MSVELKYKHDRAGDTGPLEATVVVDGSHGAVGEQGVGSAYGLPEGLIDPAGWLRASNGGTYRIAGARTGIDPAPEVHRIIISRKGVQLANVAFRPYISNGIIDANALMREDLPIAVPRETLEMLYRQIRDASTNLFAQQVLFSRVIQEVNERALKSLSKVDAAVQAAFQVADTIRFATVAEMNAYANPQSGQWALVLGAGQYYRREGSSWVLRGSASAPLVSTTLSIPSGTFLAFTVGRAFTFYEVKCDQSARVRVYGSESDAVVDANRPLANYPQTPIILDVQTSGTSTFRLDPPAPGYDPKAVKDGNVFVRVDSNSGGSVLVTLTYTAHAIYSH